MAVKGKITFLSVLGPANAIFTPLNVKNNANKTAKILVMIPGKGSAIKEPLWSKVKRIIICVKREARKALRNSLGRTLYFPSRVIEAIGRPNTIRR